MSWEQIIHTSNPPVHVKLPEGLQEVDFGEDNIRFRLHGREFTVGVYDTTEHRVQLIKKASKRIIKYKLPKSKKR